MKIWTFVAENWQGLSQSFLDVGCIDNFTTVVATGTKMSAVKFDILWPFFIFYIFDDSIY
jgi:hypothetical protein